MAEMDSLGRVVFVRPKDCCPLQLDINKWVETVPTRTRWQGDKRVKTVAYQFDGRFAGDIKNPPSTDQQWFLEEMKKRGYKLISLENRTGAKDPVSDASKAGFFVGCCSGASQICYSVGIPVFIVKYELDEWSLEAWHGRKVVAMPKNLRDFINHYLDSWLER
ncbi:MAG: hypothetical protein NTW87_24590 [Planctomycetota bacterium]|nr:hypothetical protein [Planctomycetota bacterium]